jgi:acetylornithine deacetylase
MSIARGDAVALTRALVAVDSRNPSLVAGAPGEGAIATLLADVLRDWGCAVELQEVVPGRPNVIARVGKRGGPSLMFNGHLDVVDVVGMAHPPFNPMERDGRIWGRGSSDMKSGVASMCAAAVRAVDQGLAGEVTIAAVIDEEYTSLGTRALIDRGIRADAAIVTEPTRLAIMPAHRGFVWLDLHVTGRAAHGSRWDIGIDAIRHTGLFLAELDRHDANALTARHHALLGRPSVHASVIAGGTGMSTYPDRCDLSIERRTIPGETAAQVLSEMEELRDQVRGAHPEFDATVKVSLSQAPSDVAVTAPIVRALSAALCACGVAVSIEGMSAWTDAALLNDAGIPAICFGPGDITLAHAAEEFVLRKEIEDATRVLTDLALRWASHGR